MLSGKYFFKKLTQFSIGNHVIDAPDSKTDDFVSEIPQLHNLE
jgi:hypothetical protein